MSTELIVGIDFGTTFSGVSWAVNSGKKVVHSITSWPNPRRPNSNALKVPTVISYDGDRKPLHWGFEVELSEERVEWFKLLLHPEIGQSGHVGSARDLLRSLGKTADDVVTDYLRFLWQYTKKQLEKNKGDLSLYDTRVIITVPAIWNDNAKKLTLAAGQSAGIPGNINLVTEPEAAALAALDEARDDEIFLKPGDAFTICDAGGGTVASHAITEEEYTPTKSRKDLISYRTTRTKPLQLEECAIGGGGFLGSTFLNTKFENHMKGLVGEPQYNKLVGTKHSTPEARKKAMKAREMLLEEIERIKINYEGEGRDEEVELRGVRDNPNNGVSNELVTITSCALLTLFDLATGGIIDLVDRQLKEALAQPQRIKTILLVGGFGTNKYLHQRLETSTRSRGIKVRQLVDGWSAVCRGATLWGLEHSIQNPIADKTVNARLARYSYGVKLDESFDTKKGHLEADRYRNSKGKWMAKDQMIWLVRKGERLEDHDERTHDITWTKETGWFFNPFTYPFGTTMYTCADDPPPTRYTSNVQKLCRVEFGISHIKLWSQEGYKNHKTGRNMTSVDATLRLILHNTLLGVQIFYKDEPVAYVETEFNKDLS